MFEWAADQVRNIILIVAAALAVVLIGNSVGAVDSKTAVLSLGALLGAIVAAITSVVMAQVAQHNQLRLAVADARFRAHQEAFDHWFGMSKAVHSPDDVSQTVGEAVIWWRKNCLYLDPTAREAFWLCIQQVSSYETYLTEQKIRAREAPGSPEHVQARENVLDVWRSIRETGEVLAQAVALPGLVEEEIGQPNLV